MRAVYFLICFVVSALFLPRYGACQTAEQFAANASAFAATAAKSIVVVREAYSKDAWVRLSVSLANANWDVKRTDSLLHPMVAIVKADLTSGVTKRFQKKEDAEAAEFASTDFMSEAVELEFLPNAEGWRFSKGRHFAKELGRWLELKRPPPNLPFTPYGWLIDGFSIPPQ